ncbi:MAG: triose-phosphate isomerase [Bacilli bacterium]
MRKKLLLGNWKMNKTVAEAKDFASASVSLVALAKEHNIDIGVAPTFLALDIVAKTNPNIIVAAQNVHFKENGAYTGEISIPMLKEIGISTVIIGHSERRMYDNETSEKCNLKIKKLVEANMIAVYCVGETLDEFLNNKTSDVVISQLKIGLEGVSPADLTKVIIAYEPVWSIGTGKAASKEIAENVCALIRSTIADLYNKEEAEGVRILYGGSVKPNNVKEYMSEKDIDGALVGGASLAIDSYKELIMGM